MAKGRKTGGRAKGTPNRVTRDSREVIQRIFEELSPKSGEWIARVAEGDREGLQRMEDAIQLQLSRIAIDGKVEKTIGKLLPSNNPEIRLLSDLIQRKKEFLGDPARAADLLDSLASYCVPKLQRTEVTGANGQNLPATVFRIAEAPAIPQNQPHSNGVNGQTHANGTPHQPPE